MRSRSLVLNCFPLALSPIGFSLPFSDFEDYQASTKALSEELKLFLVYRYKLDNNKVRIILLNGPEPPRELDSIGMSVADSPSFGNRLIQRTLSQYFSSRGLKVSQDKSTTKVLLSSPDFVKGHLAVHSGIEFQVRRPFDSSPENYVISVQWKASVSFQESLADGSLKEMAVGMPVLFKPSSQTTSIPEELRAFRNKYIGHVQRIGTNNFAIVSCKDGEPRQLPLSELFLEGAPAVIRQYEAQFGRRYGGQSIWHRIQEIDLVLTKAGRRNSSVFKDRLQAIRGFLGSNSKEQLVIRLNCFQEGFLTLNLSPIRLEII